MNKIAISQNKFNNNFIFILLLDVFLIQSKKIGLILERKYTLCNPPMSAFNRIALDGLYFTINQICL